VVFIYMTLKNHIKKILREESLSESRHLRRRFDQERLNQEFEESINYASRSPYKFENIEDLKHYVISIMVDGLHGELSNWGSIDFPYDEVYNFLKNEYSDEIEEYDHLIGDNELTEEFGKPTPYAVIEITKPISHMNPKYYYQEVPYWKTKEDKIYINRGSSGHKTISTKNIDVIKVFKDGNTEELQNYLKELRNETTQGIHTESRVGPEVRRRINKIDKLVDVMLNDMYVEDYENKEQFFDGVIFELGWLVRNEDFGLHDVDWIDIYNYVDQHRRNNINDYYNEHFEDEEINESELTERCWKGYTQKGMKTMFGKRYPNCVKVKKK